jgi:hypothetical protein
MTGVVVWKIIGDKCFGKKLIPNPGAKGGGPLIRNSR